MSDPGPFSHRLFCSGEVKGNVIFNWIGSPIDQLPYYASAYHRAAQVLTERVRSSAGYRDSDGYPILFLYRHALELYLKAVVLRGALLLEILDEKRLSLDRVFSSHQLSCWLRPLRAIFAAMGWNWNTEIDGLTTWDDFADIVAAIESVDASSYSFRYPMTTKGDPALPHHTVVNVLHFAAQMDGLLSLLTGAMAGINERIDTAAEVRFFLQDLLKEWQDEG